MSSVQRNPEVKKIMTPEVKKITVAPASSYLLAKRQRDQKRRKIYANICCVIITLVIFATSIALIALGAILSIEDLWILGLIIIIGGAIVLGFILGKYLYPMLVKVGARVSDKHIEEQKLHKNKTDYMDNLSVSDIDLSKKPKLTDKQLYNGAVAKRVSGAEGGVKIEISKPPLISVPGESGIVTTNKGLIYDSEMNHNNTHDDEDFSKIPPPSSYDLYYVAGNDKGQKNISPPPPYIPYNPEVNITSTS